MTGLTNEQVQERIAEGKVNVNENPNTRTYKQIILENTLTFFNFLNIALLVLVLFVRSYKNSMFMGIILINTVIGIIQEIRAKKTIDKLAILTESKTVVLREGKKTTKKDFTNQAKTTVVVKKAVVIAMTTNVTATKAVAIVTMMKNKNDCKKNH